MRAQAIALTAALLAPAWLCVPALAEPGDSHTMTGLAQVELVEPGRLMRLANLRFGAFGQPATAATLTIAPDGTATGTGDVAASMNAMPQPPDGRGPAIFRLDGTNNRAFVALIPNRITISNGSATMQVTNITTNMRNGSNRFDATGRFDLHIGGRLNIAANQAGGDYAGDFRITVIFQ